MTGQQFAGSATLRAGADDPGQQTGAFGRHVRPASGYHREKASAVSVAIQPELVVRQST